MPPLPSVIGRGRGGDCRYDAGGRSGAHQRSWQGAWTFEAGVLDPVAAAAQRLKPAAAGAAHGSAADVRIENRKRESDAYPVFAGATCQGARGQHSRSALRRRTEPAGRSSRVDRRSIRGRGFAVSVTAERDADVEHSGAGAGLDGTAPPERGRAERVL